MLTGNRAQAIVRAGAGQVAVPALLVVAWQTVSSSTVNVMTWPGTGAR